MEILLVTANNSNDNFSFENDTDTGKLELLDKSVLLRVVGVVPYLKKAYFDIETLNI